MKVKSAAIALSAVAALLLAGCGNKSDAPPQSKTTVTVSTPPPTDVSKPKGIPMTPASSAPPASTPPPSPTTPSTPSSSTAPGSPPAAAAPAAPDSAKAAPVAPAAPAVKAAPAEPVSAATPSVPAKNLSSDSAAPPANDPGAAAPAATAAPAAPTSASAGAPAAKTIVPWPKPPTVAFTPGKPPTFLDADKDLDAKLSLAEVKAVWPQLTQAEFNAADTNHSGSISADEYNAMIKHPPK